MVYSSVHECCGYFQRDRRVSEVKTEIRQREKQQWAHAGPTAHQSRKLGLKISVRNVHKLQLYPVRNCGSFCLDTTSHPSITVRQRPQITATLKLKGNPNRFWSLEVEGNYK